MKTTIGLADDCLIRQKPMQRGLTLPRATHKSVRGMSLRDALNFEIRCRRAVMATRHSRSKDKTLFDSHSRPTGKHCYLFVRTDNETPSVAMRIGNQDFSLKIAVTKSSLKQAEQFEHDYNNHNYSDYVEDASVHALS